jgi:predicted TIM-barrel fold metal-dependent hydrolase
VLTEFIPNPTFEVVARPGAHMAYFAGDNPEGKSLRELTGKPMRSIPAFREPAARLELLDEQGIAACLMFPTLASLIEERLIDDPDLTQVAIRAFNEWLHDQWTYDYQGRIFATPIVNPCVVDQGVAELERLLERGAKAVLLRPAPVSGLRGTRSPFLPEFDPFWARVEESGVVVALHASDSGYQSYINTWEGTSGEYVAFRPRTFPAVADGGRTIQDTVASAICHGMLHRFPGVKLVSVENGGGWVDVLVKQLALTYKKMPQEFPEHPVETFKRQVWVNPFWEESVPALVDLLGPERVCFGSDYPHAEGLADPLSWLDEVADLDTHAVERIVSANMHELLDLS